MSYQCYVFENVLDAIHCIEQYTQLGGDKEAIKVLIEDVSHGQQFSAAGLHHIDYLNQITSANHIEANAQYQEKQPRFFVGITNGQFTPGVVSGSFGDVETNAMEALDAYGLSEQRAMHALEEIRKGNILVFVPSEHNNYRSHRLHETMSAAFGENNSSRYSSEQIFATAAYMI